jgi:hypothetical protein
LEADRKVKTALRKGLGNKVRAVRKQLNSDLRHADSEEARQLEVLQEYAQSIQTAVNRDGTLPFDYPGVAAAQDLDALAESLSRLKKRGGGE